MGRMRNAYAMVGMSIAYIGRHFAAAIYGLGEPAVQGYARLALVERCTGMLLVNDKDSVLLAPTLTVGCKTALETAKGVRPARFGAFMAVVSTLSRSFAEAQTFRGMEIEPRKMRSVTLSVCTPQSELSGQGVQRPYIAGRVGALRRQRINYPEGPREAPLFLF